MTGFSCYSSGKGFRSRSWPCPCRRSESYISLRPPETFFYLFAPLASNQASVRQDDQGRYSLNDLHRAAGGESKHQPSNWLRLDNTKGLIDEINRSSEVRNALQVLQGGSLQGTFVCKELVYAYAMWISPAFHLKVIRAYDVCQPCRPWSTAPFHSNCPMVSMAHCRTASPISDSGSTSSFKVIEHRQALLS